MNHKNVILFVATLICPGLAGIQAQNVKDIDGNVYKTVTIGKQIWMAENLKTTKYNDGKAIPLVTDDKAWGALTTPAYCWYYNDASTNKNKYGALYNWYTVNTNKLCPKAWHVATDTEWTTLTTYLDGESVAGSKLKETGTTHWESPNAGATNKSGFTALPGGYRNHDGAFGEYGSYASNFRSNGCWWSSSEQSDFCAYYRRLYNSLIDVYRSPSDKHFGYSVRCLKD